MTSQEDNFLHNYQKLLFCDTDSDSMNTCRIRRKCLAQLFSASVALTSNETTCDLIKEKITEYASLVDDKDGINNYAEPIHALVSYRQNESKHWTSQLKDPKSTFLQCIPQLECSKGYSCGSYKVTEENIKLLLTTRNESINSKGDESRSNSLTSHVRPLISPVSATIDRNEHIQEIRNTKHFTPKMRTFPAEQQSTSSAVGFGSLYSNVVAPHQEFAGNSMKPPPVIQGFGRTSCKETFPSNTNVAMDGYQTLASSSRNQESNPPHSRNKVPKTMTASDNWFDAHPASNGPYQNFFSSTRQWNTCNNNGVGQGLYSNVQPSVSGPARSFNNEKSYQMGATNNCDTQNPSAFCTARDELIAQNQKWGKNSGKSGSSSSSYGYSRGPKRSLGARRGIMNKFIPPIRNDDEGDMLSRGRDTGNWDQDEVEDERLKNIDPKMVELIRNEIMDCGAPVQWNDIAGLQFAKATIQEIVVWPLLRPEIFTGLRRPPKGILLFGPPGTGKTLIGKCIASQSCSTFFSISASSLTSKWIGDGEKMVRALFAVARCHQPSVVFIDEIDSLLSQRSDSEHESSRRIKTEFLVQLDGATTGEEDRILVIGATNRPQELDEAARRRLVKRLYIPLPDHQARQQIIENLMSKENNGLTDEEIDELATLTDGYSGADMKNLCQEASLGPIRSIGFVDITRITPDQVRPILVQDFKSALTRVRASVSSSDLLTYVAWDKQYGSGGMAAV